MTEAVSLPLHSDQRGFTLFELIVCFLIIAILSTMGSLYLVDMRDRSGDSQAYTEGRHLITAISDAMLAGEDVDFANTKGADEVIEGPVGTHLSDGSDTRTPIYNLSSDIRARIVGTNAADPDDGEITVYLWSVRGSSDASPSGKREYFYYIDESSGIISTPAF
jgi:prepilin-type N-terminal cleavage/methylation domain-containing protein